MNLNRQDRTIDKQPTLQHNSSNRRFTFEPPHASLLLRRLHNCAGSYTETWRSGKSVAWTYQDCDNDTEITLVTIDGGGHVVYLGAETDIDTARLAWDFMKRFTK